MRNPDVYLSQTNLLIAGLVYFVICFLVAWLFGKNRKLGIGWSFLFCICFTPVVGFVITMYSEKKP